MITKAARHAAIIGRFHQIVAQHEHDGELLRVADVCRRIATSQRTLRTCCREHFGTTPKRYLVAYRLHLVRRALRHNTPDTATVTEIAARYGFWQFGRFSVSYRRLFGETPSTTLARHLYGS